MNEETNNAVQNEAEKPDWDSEIGVDEDSGFVTLPDGTECAFDIRKMEQVYSQNGNPMAKLEMICTANDGRKAYVHEKVVLSPGSMYRVRQFGLAIGHLQPKKPGKINWSALVGECGRCKLTVEEWTGRDKIKRLDNKVAAWLPQEAAPAPESETPAAGSEEVSFA